MDELEFHRVLTLFPVIRSRDYHAESESARQSMSRTKQNGKGLAGDTKGVNIQDAFWEKLKVAATKKVGAKEADGFVKAFQQVYKKLVYEELSVGAAKSLLNKSISFCGS